jgi:sulfur-oxidizing protein SoxX
MRTTGAGSPACRPGTRAALVLGAALTCVPAAARAQAVDAIEQPLHARPGDPVRGRAIVANRQRGLCLLCHRAPIPEEPFQGDIGPDLTETGDRWTPAQLRLRLVDPLRLNPGSLMPSYFRTDHLRQVSAAWQGRTVLAAEEIEDVIAYLSTLRSPRATGAPR